MERFETGYMIGLGDIIAVNGAAVVALGLFVHIALMTIGRF